MLVFACIRSVTNGDYFDNNILAYFARLADYAAGLKIEYSP